MHDIRFIRENPNAFDAALKRRKLSPIARKILKTDRDRRALQAQIQEIQSRRNQASKEIGALKAKGGDADALRVKSSTDESCASSVPPAITIHDHNPISEWPLGALDRFMSSTSRSRRPSRVMRSGPLTPIKTSPMSEGAHLMSDGPLGAFEQFMKIASRSRRPSRVHSGPQTPIKASDGCGTARATSGAQWSTPSGAFCRTRRNSAPAVRLSEYARLRAPLCASCDAEEETLDTVSSII